MTSTNGVYLSDINCTMYASKSCDCKKGKDMSSPPKPAPLRRLPRFFLFGAK